MGEKSKQKNRIPFENIEGYESISAWSLPTVEDGSRLILSAKKEQAKRKKDESSEIIEDCEGTEQAGYPTAESLQKITEEAKQEGFSQGYKDGFEKGRQKGEKEAYNRVYKETKNIVDQQVKQLKMIGDSLFQPMQTQTNALEDIILDMATHFAQQIINEEIKNTPYAMLATVKKALAALPSGANNIAVYTHSNDAEIIEKYLPADNRNWELKTDNTVQQGGCRLETAESLVDYTTTSRFQEFIKQVKLDGDVSDTAVAPVEKYSHGVETENSASKINSDDNASGNYNNDVTQAAIEEAEVDQDISQEKIDSKDTESQNASIQDPDVQAPGLQDI